MRRIAMKTARAHRTQALPKKIRFKKPPISEVVIGLYHLPIPEFKAQHVGLYWTTITDRYPLCEQQIPAENIVEVPGEIFPLPRFWFSQEGQPELLQIQRDAILLNWRNTAGAEYPHYESVKPRFFKELDVYQEFLFSHFGQRINVVKKCELTYVNIIRPNQFWSELSQVGEVFPVLNSFSSLTEGFGSFVGCNLAFQFKVNDGLTIDASIKTGTLKADNVPIQVLELKARGGPEGLIVDGISDWYDAAHEAIIRLFLKITNPKMQKSVWQPI